MRTLGDYLFDGLDDAAKLIAKRWLWIWRATITIAIFGVFWMLLVYINALPSDISPSRTNLLPTTGEQGFNVEAFCNDPLTSVTKDIIAPPDSMFVNTYTLVRVRDGVQETVVVGFYADISKQPQATHFDSDNNATPGFVNKSAASCIEKKAGG